MTADAPGPRPAGAKMAWRISEVARYLGVSRQRVQQLARAGRLPPPVGEDRVGPYWDPAEVRPWAERWASERR